MSVSFPTAYLQTFTKDGLVWADCVGCALLIYGYFISNRKNLWKVLLALGITGLFGTIIENFFHAKKLSSPDENWSFLLGMNEMNWTVFETSCVVYSLIKLETTLTSLKVKRAVRFAMGVFLTCFVIGRFNIGYLRVQQNAIMNRTIGQAHAYAYIFWFLADLLIFALLIYNTIIHMNNKKKSVSLLMNNLFKSSIPRFMIITLNTLCLTIVSFSFSEVFVDSSIIQDPASVTPLQDLSDFLWALKGTYPLILLFDIHTTKSLIMMAAENEMDTLKLNKQ
ncbi:hypothetical protein HK103_001333 [Boothiomyces macroporosus]|uniref:Uncharacterized protein n=1 Tax=Boothiomyces macroporosus TaxID=261099 RepID=A0AAD5UAQ2_9FUNG|nr:hypothetical protein HK103_001333 [Boothiomyces macroporosus]